MIASERLAMMTARELAGVSRAELARMIPSRVGCGRRLTPQALAQYERGVRNPGAATLAAWRSALEQVGAIR